MVRGKNRKFMEGLNSNVKLALHKIFRKEIQFKEYLHEMSDAGTRLIRDAQARVE